MATSRTIGRYEIRDIVGQGGMGIVYRAYDTTVGRDVALKTLVDVQGRTILELFYKEWKVLANIHHPNIVEIFDIGEFDDNGVVKPFFVMPLLSGVTLAQLLYTPGQQPSAERLEEIVSQICRGLQAIHDIGLIHRDLKPSNIMVMEFNSVKLIDFGVAHLVGGQTITGVKGTASYMSPEQIQNQKITPASDIFALGVLCYEALTGLRPFRGADSDEIFQAILYHTPQPLYELNPSVSQVVSRVVHKALAKRPEHRFARALEFSETFQKALRGEPIAYFDAAKIQHRIQRAARAFEQSDYQMATDILGDLEAAGHIDPALAPLRRQIDEALRRKAIRESLDRAASAFSVEEYPLALQNAENAKKMEPGNEEADRLLEGIRQEMARRERVESLQSAREYIEKYAFSRARQLLQKVLEFQPGEPQATEMLAEIENREGAYRAARQEKESLYRAARDAWQSYEFGAAITKLQRVLELEKKAPDTSATDSGANYSGFLKQVQSAKAAIDEFQVKVAACVAQGQDQPALELCTDCSAKYPGHPLPQGLKLDIEARREQQTLDQMAECGRGAVFEADLEKRLNALRHAADLFPGEPLFERWTRPVRDQLGLANTLVTKARVHEEHGRFLEALERWQMLRAVYKDYPGVDKEIERVGVLAAGDAFTGAPPQAQNGAAAAGASGVFSRTVSEPAPRPKPAAAEPPSTSPGSESLSVGKHAARLGAAVAKIADAGLVAARGLRAAAVAGWIALGGLVRTLVGKALIEWRAIPARKRWQVVTVIVSGWVLVAGVAVAIYRHGKNPGQRAGREPVVLSSPPIAPPAPAPRPLASIIHIFSDLPGGRLQLDKGESVDLPNSGYMKDIGPNDHQVAVSNGSGQSAEINFTISDGLPVIKESPAVKEVVAIAAAGKDGALKFSSSVRPLRISVDGKIVPEASSGSYQVGDPKQAQHKVVAGNYQFDVETGPQPAVWIWLYSDRNVGTLEVRTGLDKFRVFLNDEPRVNKIRNGAMALPNLAVSSYRVRVEAEEYLPAERNVVVKKGQSTEEFSLQPRPATLQVRNLPSGAQVSLDNAQAGTIDGNGALNILDVRPDVEHSITLRKSWYKDNTIRRTFGKGTTTTLTAKDFQFVENPGLVTLSTDPANAKLEWYCGDKLQQKPAKDASCVEEKVSWKASAQGYETEEKSDKLTPGGTLKHQIVLVHMAAAKPPTVPQPTTCEVAELPRLGWTEVSEGGWYTPRQQATLSCKNLFGRFEFTVQLPSKGTFGKAGKFSWSIDARHFDLDSKGHFSGPNVPGQEAAVSVQDGGIKFRVTVQRSQVRHEIWTNGSWKQAGETPGTFEKAQITFFKGTKLKNFSFVEE